MPVDLPLPPLDLANRVGAIKGRSDPWQRFLDVGAVSRREIVAALPADWTFEGKRVLDFGCGVGRTLRHFAAEAEQAEIWGCDIDGPSIAWMRDRLCPPFNVVETGAEPPLPFPDGQFDLVWAVSVFTHLADTWSAWLLELHRVLAPDGLLFATFMGPELAHLYTGEPGDEDRIGMHVLRYDAPWDDGGPMVLHSPWWIRAHWGRAFEVVSLAPSGFGAGDGYAGHGVAVLRRREVAPTREELEAIEPDEPREALASAAGVRDHWREVAGLRAELTAERARADDLSQQLHVVTNSRSWRLTAPLRRTMERLRSGSAPAGR